MTAQAYEPNGQALPAWESWEAYVTTLNGVPKTTERVVELPLTYYGPSIPLGTAWVYGGSTSPAASISSVSTSVGSPAVSDTQRAGSASGSLKTASSPASSSYSEPPSSLPSASSVTTSAAPAAHSSTTAPASLSSGGPRIPAGPSSAAALSTVLTLGPGPVSALSSAPEVFSEVSSATTAWSISASAAAASSDAPGSSSSTPSGLSNLASFLVALLVPLSLLLVLGLFLFALFRRRRSYAAVATALTAPDQSEKPAPVTDPSATDPPAPAHDERTSLLAPDGAGADAELAALVLASQRLLERLGVSRPSSRQSRPSRPASRLVSGNTLEKGYGDRLGPPAHARSRSAGTAATDDDVPARPASTPHTLNHVPDNELFYRAPPLSPGSTARGLGLGLGESRPVSGLALVSSDAPRHLRAGIYQRDPVRALGSALSSSSRGSHRSRSSGGSGSASSAGSRPSTRAAWARAQSPIPETPAFSLRVLDTPSSHGQHFGELGEGEGEVDVGEFGARRQCPDGERMRFPKPPATPVQPAPGAPSMERSVSGGTFGRRASAGSEDTE